MTNNANPLPSPTHPNVIAVYRNEDTNIVHLVVNGREVMSGSCDDMRMIGNMLVNASDGISNLPNM
jgi:hypothetical protein